MYINNPTNQTSPIHEELIDCAKRKLIEEDYKDISLNYPFKGGIIDLFANKDGKEYGIECLTRIKERKQKIIGYKK